MKCFHCINVTCHTEYPLNAIVSVCPRCQWRSKELRIPSKIPPVQAVSLVNQPKSNIFDQIYINNEVRVDSMSQISNEHPEFTYDDDGNQVIIEEDDE